jgi:hypothetical protein
VVEQDHDQRFKTLIRECFADFMELFFAEWAEKLDCQAAEWLEQEAFPDPPDGPRRAMDLVTRMPLRKPDGDGSKDWLALVHIEIESPEAATSLRRRMYRYNGHLRDRYDLPVLPIGVFLKVGLDGLGIDVYTEFFESFQTLEFRFLYVGLPALDALQYLEGESSLGIALASLMKIPKDRIAWLGAEALRRLTEASLPEKKRFLLAECVQAYLPMDEAQRAEFDQLVEAKPYAGVQAMNKTVFEQGIEKGFEKGAAQARREMLRDFVAARFGPLSDHVLNRIDSLDPDRLPALVKALPQASSLKDLGLEDQ